MKAVTIVGGGIAGLTAGIALRQRGVPVTVIESKPYPRHKVCGEFLSGRGLQVLASLGIDPSSLGGAVKTISFHDQSRNSPPMALPHPGIGLSRFRFDFMLAQTLTKIGGKLECPCRFAPERWQEGYVCATGRQKQRASKWKWFGLKAHLSGLELMSDLELHFTQNAYIGLCRLDDQNINICGLFRRRVRGENDNPDFLEHFTSAPSLRERLAKATWDMSSLAAVSGLPIGRHVGEAPETFVLGDALSMIPPFTGNGMSLALESADVAVKSLAEYARAEISWSEALQTYNATARNYFRRRFTLGNAIQRLALNPVLTHLFLRPQLLGIWRYIFLQTR